MDKKKQSQPPASIPSKTDGKFEIELHQVPIVWDLENGNMSFFGMDSSLFWTDPSLVRMLAPLAEEIGNKLFRLLVAYSSSLGTKEDYYNMVSTLGDSFQEGFLAWGKAVSAAGWGTFQMPEYNLNQQQATVIVHNPWEISMQRNLLPEQRWGCPFLQGKLIGIFSNAFNSRCWANDICHYDRTNPHVKFEIYPSNKTINNELKKLRYKKMLESEKALTEKINQKTLELQKAKKEIEEYSETLEQRVAEQTNQLVETNKQLKNEIETRKEAEANKEKLIIDLQKTLKEVSVLRGFLPICSSCKKIRDDQGYWNQLESYIQAHSDTQFSHSMCPDCAKKLYGDLDF
jgi:hypothetical protein